MTHRDALDTLYLYATKYARKIDHDELFDLIFDSAGKLHEWLESTKKSTEPQLLMSSLDKRQALVTYTHACDHCGHLFTSNDNYCAGCGCEIGWK